MVTMRMVYSYKRLLFRSALVIQPIMRGRLARRYVVWVRENYTAARQIQVNDTNYTPREG